MIEAMSSEANWIATYLRSRPIAPILEQSNEKENLIALKFMYCLNYEIEQNKLYDRMQNANSDALMMKLMEFKSFKSFLFYEYTVKQELDRFALLCTVCGLLGPYRCILSHMAINHNTHTGSKMCLYCDGIELQKHFDENSLKQCYRNYSREQNINESDRSVCKVVKEFYDLLKEISVKFSLITTRSQQFTAKR